MKARDPVEFIESYKGLSRTVKMVVGQEYAALELGVTQAGFLRYIGRTPGISQAELARMTQTDPGLTGRVLETLIEKGWVRRTRSSEDRRQYVLELSAPGQRVRKRAEDARRRGAEQLVALLDEKDLDAFDRISKKLVAGFGEL